MGSHPSLGFFVQGFPMYLMARDRGLDVFVGPRNTQTSYTWLNVSSDKEEPQSAKWIRARPQCLHKHRIIQGIVEIHLPWFNAVNLRTEPVTNPQVPAHDAAQAFRRFDFGNINKTIVPTIIRNKDISATP